MFCPRPVREIGPLRPGCVTCHTGGRWRLGQHVNTNQSVQARAPIVQQRMLIPAQASQGNACEAQHGRARLSEVLRDEPGISPCAETRPPTTTCSGPGPADTKSPHRRESNVKAGAAQINPFWTHQPGCCLQAEQRRTADTACATRSMFTNSDCAALLSQSGHLADRRVGFWSQCPRLQHVSGSGIGS
jgi:hypothetical protein